MKALVDSVFWSDSDVELQTAGGKLVALWLMTNSSTNLLGICNASAKRFAFETGLPEQALAKGIKGMPRSFIGVGNAIFVKNYIRYQFGHGEKLLRNNFFVRLRREFDTIKDEALRAAVLDEYPEFASPCQGEPKGGEGKGREGTKNKRKGTSTPKIREPLLPHNPQAIQLAACVGRSPQTPWSEKEIKTFQKLKIDQSQLDRLSVYYAKNRKRDDNICRRDLFTLLGNYAGECDRANAWFEKYHKQRARPPATVRSGTSQAAVVISPETFKRQLEAWKSAGRPFERVEEFFPSGVNGTETTEERKTNA